MIEHENDRIEAALEFTDKQLCVPELYEWVKEVLHDRYASYFYHYIGMNRHDLDNLNPFVAGRDNEQSDYLWERIYGAFDDEIYDLFQDVKREFVRRNGDRPRGAYV